MLFDRYGEVLVRLEELGARVGNLNNRDRQVMQNLLEEQEWLSATLVKRAKFLLEEIDRSFEKLFDWMITFSDLIDRASSHGGTPAEVMRMERMMQEADDLREQLNRMVTERDQREDVPFIITAGAEGKREGLKQDKEHLRLSVDHLSGARREAAPTKAQAEILVETVPPFLRPAGTQTNTVPQVHPQATVVKKMKKKDRKRNKKSDDQQKYQPPKELLSVLEQKMAAACEVPKAKKMPSSNTQDSVIRISNYENT